MLTYVGGRIRFISSPHEVGYINEHGKALLVVKLCGRTLKAECLGGIVPTGEQKPSIYRFMTNGILWQGAKQFSRRWSDISQRFNVRKQVGSGEFPVDAFVLIWVPCKISNGGAARRRSQTSLIQRNMEEGSGGQQSA